VRVALELPDRCATTADAHREVGLADPAPLTEAAQRRRAVRADALARASLERGSAALARGFDRPALCHSATIGGAPDDARVACRNDAVRRQSRELRRRL